jgi:hypothetical protein
LSCDGGVRNTLLSRKQYWSSTVALLRWSLGVVAAGDGSELGSCSSLPGNLINHIGAKSTIGGGRLNSDGLCSSIGKLVGGPWSGIGISYTCVLTAEHRGRPWKRRCSWAMSKSPLQTVCSKNPNVYSDSRQNPLIAFGARQLWMGH